MWRWTVFLCLIFYGHTLSQPVTDDNENVRHTRQLDFGECCPCPGPGGFADQESTMPNGDAMFARARDIGDCPCRPRTSDSEGASSILFPTSSRYDGNFVRPVDKKEDLKPLLHPEVDLASSVLQTLREATDEEYRDALARDAARSMAKETEETLFGDTLPEASNGNVVTIIVNPKHTESLDDVIPQETHVQETRCVHAPLESVNTNLDEMRVTQKPPSLLREIFGLPRLSKPSGLLHKNLLDMDNGASNIQERVVNVDNNQVSNKTVLGLRKYAPFMKLDKNMKDKSTNKKINLDVNTNVKKVPDFKLPSMKNKLKDLIANRTAFESKVKTNSLPLIPRMSVNNPLLTVKGKNEEDLSLSPSNIHEQVKKSFFQTKSHLENIFQNKGPGGLKNLLKLKDVEFVPLKDLVPKAADRPTLNRPKLALPDIFKKRDSVSSTNMARNPINVGTEIIETIPKPSQIETFDAEVSPTNIFEQINDDNCNKVAFKTTELDGEDAETKVDSTDIIDTASSPSEIEEFVSDTSNNLANSQSHEVPDNTDDCDIKTLPVIETNLSQSMESFFENEALGNDEEEFNFKTSKEITPLNAKAEDDPESEFVSNDEDCVSNTNDADSITDSSNNINDVLKPNNIVLQNVDDSLVNENTVSEKDCSQEVHVSDDSKTLDIHPIPVIKPLDETLSTIKEKIAKHIENFKNSNINSKTSKIFDIPTSSNIVAKESSPITEEKLDSDCQNEESIEVTTRKSDICNDDLNIENEPEQDKVSMQDLQKISDEMLQEEQERESRTLNCSEPKLVVTDLKTPIEVNSVENESTDPEPSANTQNELIMDPQNIANIVDENDNDVKNTCQNDLTLPKQSFEKESDANVEASESNNVFTSPLLLNKALQPNENDFSLKIPLPDIQDIKLAPLPTLDDIKLSFTNLFDNPERDVEEPSASEAASIIDTSNILAPIMSTDASARDFQSILPPLRLEDVDLDILQLKPPSHLFPKVPKLDLHSFRTKLPLPTDLRIKPIKLQSVFENKGGFLGDTLSLGQNNPWETIPGLADFGSRVKTNTQKITKTLRKPDTLRNSLKSSQGTRNLSDTKHYLKNMQHTLESKLRGATTKPVNLQSNDLLETISRNHEDVNDKLRALHVDFNDRLETMRNNLFDKSLFGSGESRSSKSFSAFSTKNKDKKLSQPQSLSSRRESKKTLKPRRLEQQRESRIGSSHGLQKKFKMPTAASVPVPKTIKVPELKATLTKSPGLGIQRASGVNPMYQNIDAPQPKESSITLWKQGSKKLPMTNTRLGKTINPFKDSKFKVSFSTTPQPSLPTRFQSKTTSKPASLNLRKTTGRLGQRLDHSGSPSELKHSIISPSISDHLDQNNHDNYDLESDRQRGALSTWKLGDRENLEQSKMSNELKSWPKLTESAFLSKVKEAVNARMSKVNSPVTSKRADGDSLIPFRGKNGDVINLNTDMTRSASTNVDVIEGQALKENVSYKCTMVCTKE